MAESQLDLLTPHAADSRFIVRQSPRARHLAITVGAHGVVEVIVPKRTRPATVERFVKQHREWIDRTLIELAKNHPPIIRDMPDELYLPAIDKHWTVRYATERTRDNGGMLEIATPQNDQLASRAEFHKWLKRKARACLVPRLEQISADTGLHYKRVQIRGQRTRWGSCSSNGTVSLNFCLLFLPPELADQVFLHELCHTRHMNHSRAFWRLVREHAPQYRTLEKHLDAAWRDVPGWVGLY